MTWGTPWVLVALIVPLLGLIGIRRLMRLKSLPRWPAMKRVAVTGSRVKPDVARKARPALFVMLAIALALVAIARPQWGEHSEESYSHTREVMIALDLSRSMMTEDVEPTRLDHAREITENLLDSLDGESVGLIVFAGTAFVQVPLSPDYQIVREFLPSLEPDYMPQGGSDYGRMLDAALEGFSETADRDRYLIVLSDGQSSTESWNARLAQLAKRQIHVVSMGLGTDEGGFVPAPDGGFLLDANGDTVHSQLMPATLQALARRTNGSYYDANALKGVDDIEEVLAKTVETGRKGRVSAEASSVRTERFQWFLLPAVLLGLLSLATEFRQRPRPRQVRNSPGDAAPSLAASLALFALAAGLASDARAHFDSEAEFDVRQVFESNPVKRLRAITEHLAEFDYDAFDLRLMVEESIRYGLDAQRTGLEPSEGVLRDAMEATKQGEALDASTADWSYYRSQLSALLAPAEAAAAKEEESRARKELLDEEDNPPVVTGDSSQQSATDSFGQGASSKTDAVLGDLTTEGQGTTPRRKPTPPGKVRAATLAASGSAGGGPQDAILELARKRLEDAAKKDSPGRVHQLLAGSTTQQDANAVDW